MNCDDFDRDWQRRLDIGAGATSGSMLTHLQECPRCRAWHQAWQTLEQAIENWPTAIDPVVGVAPSGIPTDSITTLLSQHVSVEQLPHRSPSLNNLPSSGVLAPTATVRRQSHKLTWMALSALTALICTSGAWQSLPWNLRLDGPVSGDRISGVPPAISTLSLPETSPPALVRAGLEAPPKTMQPKQPAMVKPLVGMVHNVTSLVLPGWPSAWNDSVGIPHYLDSRRPLPASNTAPNEPTGPETNRSDRLPPPALPLPEPVEELIAVATESVQTMWHLASDW
jgi:hypothetical protein